MQNRGNEMKIETNIIIHHPIEKIWNKLTDFESYHEWNPFIQKIVGPQVVGEKLEIDIVPPGGKKSTFRPVLITFDKNKEMRWVGSLGSSWIFRGEHYFILEKIDENETSLIHGEVFSGALIPIFRCFAAEKTLKGFHLMNAYLADE
jgi:hypothetical protein